MKTILTNGTVIDGTGAAPRPVTIVVEDDRITALSEEPVAVDGARVLDVEGGYVLPGLWEVHTHLGDLISGSAQSLGDRSDR